MAARMAEAKAIEVELKRRLRRFEHQQERQRDELQELVRAERKVEAGFLATTMARQLLYAQRLRELLDLVMQMASQLQQSDVHMRLEELLVKTVQTQIQFNAVYTKERVSKMTEVYKMVRQNVQLKHDAIRGAIDDEAEDEEEVQSEAAGDPTEKSTATREAILAAAHAAAARAAAQEETMRVELAQLQLPLLPSRPPRPSAPRSTEDDDEDARALMDRVQLLHYSA